MPLPDWIALQLHYAVHAALGVDAPMPGDQPDNQPQHDPDIVAEAEAYLRAHSALRDP